MVGNYTKCKKLVLPSLLSKSLGADSAHMRRMEANNMARKSNTLEFIFKKNSLWNLCVSI